MVFNQLFVSGERDFFWKDLHRKKREKKIDIEISIGTRN